MSFQSFTPISSIQGLSASALGVPPGTAVEPQVAELLRDLAVQLGLKEMGVVTPWATRVGDMSWREIENPDTNIAMFQLTDSQINEATSSVLFGQPLPFVTIATGELQMISEINRILENSNYELFETQGVYSQNDSDPIPTIVFLHWLRVKDLSDQPTRNVKSMDQVAKEMQGSLTFSQQVPVEGTTTRQPPSVSFEDAFNLQEPAPIDSQPELPGPPNPPVTFPGDEDTQVPEEDPGLEPSPVFGVKGSMAGPVLVGIGVLAATILIAKAVKK